jgi:molybdopterin synthase catalytic subunit
VVRIQSSPLSVDEAVAAVRRPDCGAVAVFLGTVRDRHDGRRVTGLSYSSYEEMARKEMEAIEAEARRRWKLGEVFCAHRTGRLEIGDASVVIAVSAAHRAEAFEACRFAIETLKKTVPIWKEEFYEGSGKAWVGGE